MKLTNHPEMTVIECAETLGVGRSTLERWRADFNRSGLSAVTAHNNDKEEKDLLKENVRLQRELREYAVWVSRREVSIQKVLQFSTEITSYCGLCMRLDPLCSDPHLTHINTNGPFCNGDPSWVQDFSDFWRSVVLVAVFINLRNRSKKPENAGRPRNR